MEFMIADGWLLLGVTCGVGSLLTFVEHSVMETECQKAQHFRQQHFRQAQQVALDAKRVLREKSSE